MESNTIIYNHPADGRVYIVQNHFAGTKHLSEVLESLIELSLNQKAANQDDSSEKEKTNAWFQPNTGRVGNMMVYCTQPTDSESLLPKPF